MWCAFSDRCVCLNVSIALFDAVLWVTVGAPKPTKSCRRVAYLAVQAGTGTTLARRSGIFSPLPSDERLHAAWNRAIPRADKDLTTKSRVCSIHFHDQDIRKTYVHVINGETVEIPRGKWSLVEGALPKVFPNLPSYLSKPAEKRRKRQRESNGNADQGTASPQSQASCSTIPADVVVDDMPEPSAPSFAEMECVELPPSWQRITEEKRQREQREPGLKDSEGTEMFTMQVNDLFDVLNAKHPATGIRKNSPKIKVIEDFLVMLNETEKNSIEKNTKLFASQLTTESLRVTLMSVLDIITLLLDKDVRYVLTAKLNQDPLERFFRVVMSFGGDEDHPTIVHFGQILGLLSLYTPLKMATKGNRTGDADPVLVTMEESLSSKRLEVLHQKKEREDKLGQLMHNIVLEKLPEEDANQHDYGRPTPHDAALYYLAGYVVKKAEKFLSCDDCKAATASCYR
ncbi:hypothetical protein HPB48_027125 [Haemaphysalis longicornis]|uniref:THAP-type domain-containing protein n=1 Tax=Haemaphysalis longicornis TaxID=44386 RepID=A0A9J6HB62_HAELO|nr:hypothetical protein HPB48_027125 [Haemaphysalis longicornis]